MSIFKLSSPCASGKTFRIAELCSLPLYKPKCVLYCSPTIRLMKQTAQQLEKNGVTPILVHSQLDDTAQSDEPVIEQLKAVLRTAPAGSKVLATHKTLLRLMCCPYFDQATHLSRWHLFLDEETAIVNDHYFKAATIDSFANPLETTPEGELVIREDYKPKLMALASRVTDDHSLLSPRYCELVDRIVAPIYKVFGECNPTHISAVSVINPYELMRFAEVVLIAGLFEKTLTSLIWEHTFSLDIQPFEHITEWWQNIHLEGKRMTIRYVLPERVDASVTKLGANNVAEQIGATVFAHWPNEEFIHTSNKTVRDPNGKSIANPMRKALREASNGLSIKPISHGLNEYDHYQKVAALAITQPDNRQVSRVAQLSGLTIQDVRRTFRIMSVYQTVCRTEIRVKGSKAPIEVIVLDKAAAMELADIFEGSTVAGQLGDVQCPPSKEGPKMTRPTWMSPIEWRAESTWLKNNRAKGLAGTLKPKQQERFSKYYPFSKHWRDSQVTADAFDIVPGGYTVAAANTIDKAA